jgi:hypothetical protein
LDVPVDAVPEDVPGVNGAHKELENELEVAHTEQDILCSVQNSLCFWCQISSKEEKVANSLDKCCHPKAEAEDD